MIQPSTRRPGVPHLLIILAVAAAARLSRWPTPESAVLGGGEYDPAVMYTAAAMLINGDLPYRDFVYLHPPGSLLGFAPFALLGHWLGDAQGLALARVAVALLGLVNVTLVWLHLRGYGRLATTAGAGLYAAWSALAYAEQQPLLEPFLMTALLAALLLIRNFRPVHLMGAGVWLGTATMVKVWAVVDLVIIGLVLLAWQGWKKFRWFLLGGAVGGTVIGLPFFAQAPVQMWEMVVGVQMGRSADGVGLATRAAMFGPAPYLGHPAYVIVMSVGMAALLLLTLTVTICGIWVTRSRQRRPPENVVWGLIASAHAVMLLIAPSFYDHYAMFLAGPLTLVLGSLGERFREENSGAGGGAHFVTWAVVIVMALASVAGSLYRVATTDHMTASERETIVEWATGFRCIWASTSDRVLIDAVSSNLDQACELVADPYGETLLARHRGERPPSSRHMVLDQTEAVVFPADESKWPIHKAHHGEFRDRFEYDATVGTRSLWRRN